MLTSPNYYGAETCEFVAHSGYQAFLISHACGPCMCAPIWSLGQIMHSLYTLLLALMVRQRLASQRQPAARVECNKLKFRFSVQFLHMEGRQLLLSERLQTGVGWGALWPQTTSESAGLLCRSNCDCCQSDLYCQRTCDPWAALQCTVISTPIAVC
jgi:hypothetical protein